MNNLRLYFILLLAASLRFYRLAGSSLWADEGNSVALARRSLAEIARRTAFDIHPPLYYWLLKLWITLFGDREIGLRSLSAVLGIGLVYVTWRLGRRLYNARVGRIAAFIVAISPFQLYYAQEARMYMLLTLLAALTVWAALEVFGLDAAVSPGNGSSPCHSERSEESPWGRLGGYSSLPAKRIVQNDMSSLVYILIVTAGLYTHYAYPLILAAVNLAVIIRRRYSWRWLILHLIPLALYAPWLPIAWRQVTTWPAAESGASLPQIWQTIAVTLLLGHSWPFATGWLIPAGLGLLLLAAMIRGRRFWVVWLWLLLPVALTAWIFSPAFLKFLLAATPALALLLAVGIAWPRPSLGSLLLAGLSGLMLISLYTYYTGPSRDNYRAIVRFIQAVSGPADAIILHAEGQQDVFNYYYGDGPLPVYPLPRQRPLDEAATLAELEQIAAEADQIYAVYWATRQADPGGLIENWLDQHLFKATDQWYGNVRLVIYAAPLERALQPVDYALGPDIRLRGYALAPSRLAGGDVLRLALRWQAETRLNRDYTVFIQLLDGANHLVGQRDAGPVRPSSTWPVGRPITDTHGLWIEPGTPPGFHRLIVGLYDSQTGQRLEPGFIELAGLEVTLPVETLPVAAFQMQHSLDRSMLGTRLLGYDLYKAGHRSSPETPVQPGDLVRLVAYWSVERAEPGLPDQLTLRVAGGDAPPVTYPLAGVDYPPGEWPPGRIIRAQYDFFVGDLPPGPHRLALTVAGQGQKKTALVGPFQVE